MSENTRLETFCDGVFAIALTLLIIEVKVPTTAHVETSADLWRALGELLPAVFAFLLSFAIIFITWVNHHGAFKLIHRSSPAFVYANGVLLLGIVIVPFPTALLGASLSTDHAAPAVVLYSAVDALLAVGWLLFSRTAGGPNPLTRSARAAERVRRLGRDAIFAVVFYTVCAIAAAWWPRAMAGVITVVWCVWFAHSLRMRTETQPSVESLPAVNSSTMVTS